MKGAMAFRASCMFLSVITVSTSHDQTEPCHSKYREKADWVKNVYSLANRLSTIREVFAANRR